jgi:protein-disulfide isomerase
VVKPRRRTRDNRKFYMTLGAIAIVGAAIVGYAATRPAGAGVVAVDPSVPDGPVEGYVMGSPTAPVEIVEYADFECPACAQFAIVTEPQVRQLLVETGKARIRFFDYPIPSIHPNTMSAHLAAACANDQGKFWEMHDLLFQGQDRWNGQRTSKPKSIFSGYARQIALDEKAWEACYDDRRHLGRIQASAAAGQARRVQSTPTFIVGGRMFPGAIGYDQLKAMVDSATAAVPVNNPPPPVASDSARAKRP